MNSKKNKLQKGNALSLYLSSRFIYIDKESGPEVVSQSETEEEKKESKEKTQQSLSGIPIKQNIEGEKAEKEIQEESENNPNIPPRSPDALSGSEFAKEYEKVQKDPKARQKLVIEQIAKGNVPSNFRLFEPVSIEKGGQKITINVAKRGLTIGEGEDTFELPLDGPTSRAVADMLNCTIPTNWLSEQIYRHAKDNEQTVPFYHQGDFAKHDDSKMQRVEWMRKQQEYGPYKDAFAKVLGDRLVAGYFKDVVHPVPGVKVNDPKGVEIYGGYYRNGNRVQGLSGRLHNETYLDYSHRTRLISRTAYINGKKVDIGEIIKDPVIAKHFGFTPLDIDKSYEYSKWSDKYDANWAKQFVDDYKKNYPPGEGAIEPIAQPLVADQNDQTSTQTAEVSPVPPAEDTETTAIPARTTGTAGGYSPPAGQYEYSGQSQPQQSAEKHVSAPQESLEVANKNKVIVLGDSLSAGAGPHLGLGNVTPLWEVGRHASSMIQIFKEMPENQCRGATLYVLGGSNDLFVASKSVDQIKRDLQEIYSLAKKRGMKVIAATLPPLGNSSFLGSSPSHVQKEEELRDRWDELNNWILGREGSKDNEGTPNGPDKVLRFHEYFADPADRYVIKPESRASDGVHLTSQAYREMAGQVRDAALQYEQEATDTPPAAAETPVEQTSAKVFERAQTPREFVKNNTVPPINGPTVFFGSSSNKALSRSPYLKNGGHAYYAENGKTTHWLLNKVKSESGRLNRFKNAVVLIGTNDIGGNETPETIFERMNQIWDEILKANPNINLHICTMPPFGEYSGYKSRKTEIEDKRIAVNEQIRAAARQNPRLKLIDLCLPVEQGGLATQNGAALDPSVSYRSDPLHAETNSLAIVYGKAINASA